MEILQPQDEQSVESRLECLEFNAERTGENLRDLRHKLSFARDLAVAVFVGFTIGKAIFGNNK